MNDTEHTTTGSPYEPEAIRAVRARGERDGLSPQDQGRLFETVMARVLADSSAYSQRFSRVWLWGEWPGRDGGDSGVDLVAEETDGGLCAIQCKLYEPGSTVPSSDIDSFLAKAAGDDFSSSILVTTGDLTAASHRKIDKASKHCELIDSRTLDSWGVDWDAVVADPSAEHPDAWPEPRTPRADQRAALDMIEEGLKQADRGKLIMPCGTGKSLVSLWAAERLVGAGGRVLYLVPSLALMAQTMRVWAANRDRELRHSYAAVCSDAKAGARNADSSASLSELMAAPTTDPAKAAQMLSAPASPDRMEVWFCTYQSMGVLGEAFSRAGCGARPFGLMICDEAHRTTGFDQTTRTGVSPFVMCHDDKHVPACKRLYQTATPRVFTPRQKAKLADDTRGDINAWSMDDARVYGRTLYEMTFAEAASDELRLISDYRVVVIGASEEETEELLRADQRFAEAGLLRSGAGAASKSAIDIRYLTKLLGCWDAMATPTSTGRSPGTVAGQLELTGKGGAFLRSAISFSNTVKSSKGVARSGEFFAESSLWEAVSEALEERHGPGGRKFLRLESDHVDGTDPTPVRNKALSALERHSTGAAGTEVPTARILSNAQLLSEGVDVPALDAVLFMEPKKSAVQVTQAVGRAVRKAEGKEFGYVVIPVVVPKGQTMEDVIETDGFDAVWQVVRALRSHDERVDYWVNDRRAAWPVDVIVPRGSGERTVEHEQLQLDVRTRLEEKIHSRMVEMCGDRRMLPTWGKQAARICDEVRAKVDCWLASDQRMRTRLDEFIKALQASAGIVVTQEQAVEMVCQHAVTMPVLDSLFSDARFASSNPISSGFNSLLSDWADQLADSTSFGCASEAANWLFGDLLAPLDRNYRIMGKMYEQTHSAAERVDLLRQIYDGFFNAAMPDAVKSLGIAYTPVEIVDFVLRATDAVHRKHFNRGLTDKGVHVMDPFTGTGTFLYRLLTVEDADGNRLIRDADIERKFSGTCRSGKTGRCLPGSFGQCSECDPIELHASEILPLAYYIAALKIEAGYGERNEDASYKRFDGIVLRDTFVHKPDTPDTLANGLGDNARMADRQDDRLATVIIGNPPWGAGKKSAGDDAGKTINDRIKQDVSDTYGKRHKELAHTGKGAVKSLGDMYVHAIRWASDRLHVKIQRYHGNTRRLEPGIVAFVHPNSLSTAPSLAGMRATLRDEFTDIYVVNLRGDAYKSGEERRAEGDVLFGATGGKGGSRNGVQITIAVADPESQPEDQTGRVHYVEVRDGCTLAEKFEWLAELGPGTDEFFSKFELVPENDRHDWVHVSDGSFEKLPIAVCGSTKGARGEGVGECVACRIDALGVGTNCDAFAYAFGRQTLARKMRTLIEEYTRVRVALHGSGVPVDEATLDEAIAGSDKSKIKWHDGLKRSLRNDVEIVFDESRIRRALYRPFQQMWLYEDDRILYSVKRVSEMFPRDEHSSSSSAPPPIRHRQHQDQPAAVRMRRKQTASGPMRHRATGTGHTEAMLIPCPTTRTIPAVLATRQMPDLHVYDPGTRALIRIDQSP